MVASSKHALLLFSALGVGAGLAGCGEATSTGNFSGPSKVIAQRIADLQTHATESNEKKLCKEDLSAGLLKKLAGTGKSCPEVLKQQLKSVEEVTLNVKSVSISGKSATAAVQSTYSGKLCTSTVLLVEEARAWKISGLRSSCT